MKARKDAYNWLIVLERGEKLVAGLQKAIAEQGIKSGWIFGIGAAEWTEIGYYDLEKKQYNWEKIDGPMEILSLQGNVAIGEDGKPAFHIHGTFADDSFASFGGHVKDLEVAGTCEIFLHDWFSDPIKRKADPNTGLNLLDL